MANIGVSSIKLIDSDGDALDDGAGKLNVNATLVAGASIDIGDVEVKGHSSVQSYRNRAVGTSAEIINGGSAAGGSGNAGDSIPCKHIDIMPDIDNTGIIYVGGSSVTSANGIALYPGDTYSLDIDDANKIYVLSSVDAEDIAFVVYN